MEIFFSINIGNHKEYDDQTKGRHLEINKIPTNKRSEDACKIS